MNTAEIMAELPKLPAQEVESIYFRAAALLGSHLPEETPELLAALDEAEASHQTEGGISAKDQAKFWSKSLGEY